MVDQLSVLVVEDEALILLDVVDQLEADGFHVYEATNADAAIQMMVEHPDICLMFTDIDMPGSMDGLELAAAVRDRWPPVKIVVTSGRRTVEITDMPDGSMFFAKPYRHHSVAASMRTMLSAA